jgi:hypothetical protein
MNAVQNGGGGPDAPGAAGGGIMYVAFIFIHSPGVIDAAGLSGILADDNCFEMAAQGEGNPAVAEASLAVLMYFFRNSTQGFGFAVEPLESEAEAFGLMKLAQKGPPPPLGAKNLVFKFVKASGLIVVFAVIGIPKASSSFEMAGQAGFGGFGFVVWKETNHRKMLR